MSQNKEPANEQDPNPEVTETGPGEQPGSPCNSLEDLKNIRQLETLARAHTLLASLSGQGSHNHEQDCLMAYGYIIRIWQVCWQITFFSAANFNLLMQTITFFILYIYIVYENY